MTRGVAVATRDVAVVTRGAAVVTHGAAAQVSCFSFWLRTGGTLLIRWYARSGEEKVLTFFFLVIVLTDGLFPSFSVSKEQNLTSFSKCSADTYEDTVIAQYGNNIVKSCTHSA